MAQLSESTRLRIATIAAKRFRTGEFSSAEVREIFGSAFAQVAPTSSGTVRRRTPRVRRRKLCTDGSIIMTPDLREGLWPILHAWIEADMLRTRRKLDLDDDKAHLVSEFGFDESFQFGPEDEAAITAYLDRHPRLVRVGLGRGRKIWMAGQNRPPRSRERPQR